MLISLIFGTNEVSTLQMAYEIIVWFNKDN